MQTTKAMPFQASHYKINTYNTCPQKYFFEYLDEDLAPIKRQIKKPRPELEVGNVVHVTLFNYFKEPKANRTFLTLKNILASTWKPPRGKEYGFTDLDEERLWFKDALLMLKTFYEHQSEDQHLFYVPDPYSREEFIKIPLGEDLTLLGKVDRIDEEDDSSLHIIDYKTGRSQEDDDFQVMTYVILAKQKFNREVKKASYFYLRTGHWKTFTPGSGDEKITIEKIKRLVSTIKADELFEAKPSNYCKWCDYLEFCPKKKEALEYINGNVNKDGEKEEFSNLPF